MISLVMSLLAAMLAPDQIRALTDALYAPSDVAVRELPADAAEFAAPMEAEPYVVALPSDDYAAYEPGIYEPAYDSTALYDWYVYSGGAATAYSTYSYYGGTYPLGTCGPSGIVFVQPPRYASCCDSYRAYGYHASGCGHRYSYSRPPCDDRDHRRIALRGPSYAGDPRGFDRRPVGRADGDRRYYPSPQERGPDFGRPYPTYGGRVSGAPRQSWNTIRFGGGSNPIRGDSNPGRSHLSGLRSNGIGSMIRWAAPATQRDVRGTLRSQPGAPRNSSAALQPQPVQQRSGNGGVRPQSASPRNASQSVRPQPTRVPRAEPRAMNTISRSQSAAGGRGSSPSAGSSRASGGSGRAASGSGRSSGGSRRP
ncbi:MAG: hypothetical protein HRF50_08715 [Phycisphaerae bacterium]|jgi:uncharacterized membrane protein YgcG